MGIFASQIFFWSSSVPMKITLLSEVRINSPDKAELFKGDMQNVAKVVSMSDPGNIEPAVRDTMHQRVEAEMARRQAEHDRMVEGTVGDIWLGE